MYLGVFQSFIGFAYGTPTYIRASQQKGEFVKLIKRLLNNVNVPVVLSVSNACGSCASTRQLHKIAFTATIISSSSFHFRSSYMIYFHISLTTKR